MQNRAKEKKPPLQVHPTDVRCPTHRQENPVDAARSKRSKLLSLPQKLGALRGGGLKKRRYVDHFTGLNHGFGHHHVCDILGRLEPDGVLHPSDVGHQVRRVKWRIREQLKGLITPPGTCCRANRVGRRPSSWRPL